MSALVTLRFGDGQTEANAGALDGAPCLFLGPWDGAPTVALVMPSREAVSRVMLALIAEFVPGYVSPMPDAGQATVEAARAFLAALRAQEQAEDTDTGRHEAQLAVNAARAALEAAVGLGGEHG